MSKESRKALLNLNGLGLVFMIGAAVFGGFAVLNLRFDLLPQIAVVIGIGVLIHVGRLCLIELIELNERE